MCLLLKIAHENSPIGMLKDLEFYYKFFLVMHFFFFGRVQMLAPLGPEHAHLDVLLLFVLGGATPHLRCVVKHAVTAWKWARFFVPENIWSRLNDMKYLEKRYLENTRLYQWDVAINFITQRPWLGWGAAAFSVLYPLRTNIWLGHSHNFPLEIGVSHGLPVAILIVTTI